MSFVELSKDSDCDVRRSAAGNPNTPVDVLVELSKDSDCDVRRSAAGNPNTPVDVLVELSKDSDCDVRRSAAGNPNIPGYTPSDEEFIVTETYVAIKGTNHLWYKHNYPNVAPFYTYGCFCGSREQLISRIYSINNLSIDPAVRMRILNALDQKFKEIFRR
ncbi:HEAT repeat domain-containing protein [Bacteroides faecis]|uniref:HEAT repeat domain-containing protein n=1 Tax=Bacteroides faecis TaxID=674529 RepID=UPI0021649201|nr:HEAT repeat domain-containing protein [Bacteroides faecis]UVS37017.1 HEAT repeat domain-containing protein [Bacteroides faecis]